MVPERRGRQPRLDAGADLRQAAATLDAHFDQVMARRAQLERDGAPPRRYFAYSTVLDSEAFAEWSAQHAYGFFRLPEGTIAEALDLDLKIGRAHV